MKGIVFIILLFVCNVPEFFAQNDLEATTKLATTAKIWGFLKYYHPEVASGKVDWDNELMDLLPKVENAKNKEELSKLYIDLINNLGIVKVCKRCDKVSDSDFFMKNFDMKWTEDNNVFTEDLSAKLKFIETNRYQGDQYYVEGGAARNVAIRNESNQELMSFAESNYRLLGLFRYWNIVEYFYPYKYLTDQKWNDVLIEIIPKFLNAKDEAEYHLAIKELTFKVNDTHVWISLENKGDYKSLPIKLKYFDDQVVVSGCWNDSIAKNENFKLGDVILKIDGVPVDSLIETTSKYISVSNETAKRTMAFNYMTSGLEDFKKLNIFRGGKEIILNSKMYDYKDFNYYNPNGKVIFKKLEETVGYVNMMYLNNEMIEEMMNSFMETKGIILDLRGYPKMTFIQLSRYFQQKGNSFSVHYRPNFKYPGTYIMDNDMVSKTRKISYPGKIVILVDDQSLSRSEYAAMAFQNAENAVTIGSQTLGADGEVVVFEYLGGYKTAFSGNGILYPDGTETQRKGVKIDIEIKPTIEGLRQGRDEILEKAIEIINQK